MEYTNIVLNIPHSSINGFSDGWSSYSDLFKEVKRLTDWHTDILFKPEPCLDIKSIVFSHSRFKVDVERLENDPLEAIGQGIIYREMNGCIREVSNENELMELYKLHHAKINESVVDGSVLIDCHSFSSSTCKDVDVCIGFNSDDTKPSSEMLDMIVSEFNRYVPKSRIAFNDPFSNSIVATNGKKHTAFMIEFNKSLYMNEDTLELKSDWYKYNAIMNSIYRKLTTLHQHKIDV